MFCPFTVWIDCSSDLKNFANYWPSAWNSKLFLDPLKQLFLTVGQNNFGKTKYQICTYSSVLFFLRSFMEKYMHQNVSVGKTMRRGPTLLWWGHCMHILRCYLGFFSQNILLWTLERTAVPTRHLCAITDYGHPMKA